MIDFDNIEERELLNFLMTSDFDNELTFKEYKFLLKRFQTLLKVEKIEKKRFENENIDLKNNIENAKNNILIANKERDIYQNRYKNLRNRKLKPIERIKGKIK